MTDPEPLKISTPQEMVVGTQFFTCHGTKTNIVILAADDKASLLLITSSVSSVLDCSVNQKIYIPGYSCIIKVKDQVLESLKRMDINVNLSYHQCSSS